MLRLLTLSHSKPSNHSCEAIFTALRIGSLSSREVITCLKIRPWLTSEKPSLLCHPALNLFLSSLVEKNEQNERLRRSALFMVTAQGQWRAMRDSIGYQTCGWKANARKWRRAKEQFLRNRPQRCTANEERWLVPGRPYNAWRKVGVSSKHGFEDVLCAVPAEWRFTAQKLVDQNTEGPPENID